MGFTVFRGVMTTAFCLLLLMLFLVPPRYLLNVSDQAEALLKEATQALYASDPDTAKASCEALLSLYDDSEQKLERFLNHAGIDAFGSAIGKANAVLSVGDTSAALEALAEAETVLQRIRGIELFSLNSLL